MKKFLVVLMFTAIGFLAKAEYQVDAYYKGEIGPDCQELFLVMYWIEDDGTKIYQGSGTVQLGEGCDPKSNGIFNMDPDSILDFNHLDGNPDANEAIQNWLDEMLMSYKTSIESNEQESFIYKDKSGEYVLHFSDNTNSDIGNVVIMNSSGQQVLKTKKLVKSNESNELICSEIKDLPKGVYFAILPDMKGEMSQVKTVKFVVD